MLMRLYATPDDVIRARDAKISSIESMINTQRGNMERLETQKRNVESSLAEIERAGGVVDSSRVARVKTLEKRIQQIEVEIEKKLAEKDELIISFADDLDRVTQLYDKRTL